MEKYFDQKPEIFATNFVSLHILDPNMLSNVQLTTHVRMEAIFISVHILPQEFCLPFWDVEIDPLLRTLLQPASESRLQNLSRAFPGWITIHILTRILQRLILVWPLHGYCHDGPRSAKLKIFSSFQRCLLNVPCQKHVLDNFFVYLKLRIIPDTRLCKLCKEIYPGIKFLSTYIQSASLQSSE